jgi:MFS family permease
MSVAMPVYGKLSDIFGRSSVLMVASGLFALGNLVWWAADDAHLYS